MAGEIITAPLVIATAADGSQVYLYQGSGIPDGLAKGEVERLVEAELAGVPEAPPEPEPLYPDGDPSDKWTVDQIDAYAAAKGIDLPNEPKKAEKLALIAQHSTDSGEAAQQLAAEQEAAATEAAAKAAAEKQAKK